MIRVCKWMTATLLCLALCHAGPASANALADLLKSNATSDGVDASRVDALYRESILDSGGIELAVSRLQVFARRSNRPAVERANHHLSIAHLYWRSGMRDRALASLDAALSLHEGADGLLLQARIVDASGDTVAAVPWYRQALAATEDADEAAFIGLRLAMLEVSERDVEALVALAGERDQAFRNRSAVALAVLGRPDRAIELYRPGTGAFAEQIRLAEWAVAAGDLRLAQTSAWAAYRSAAARLDALYALAVLVEAYRNADALQALIDKLDGLGTLNEELLRTRVELLIETGQYGEAIAFYRRLETDGIDRASRQRLIDLYAAAGRTPEMVSEYRRLMAAEPEALSWHAALAAHYMEAGAPERALSVWSEFESHNAERLPLLVEAAGRMLEMGFVGEATGMVERHIGAHGDSVSGLTFLFETHFARGEDRQALAALRRLEAALPAGSGDFRAVADGYERMQQHAEAVRVYEGLQTSGGGLGYDERMRLAWLYGLVGDKEKALEAWQAIWLSVDSPARRSFAESQLLQLAAELSMLGDVVVDLEERLYRQRANRNDIQLLVRIYSEVGDAFSATEVIEEYARYSGGSEVERLRQLGQVYLQLSEYSKYDQVLRRLERIDPENRVEHIQNLVLNLLAFDLAEGAGDPEKEREIEHWLGELRAYDADAVSGEFEASILSMAGFNEQAVASYRRALAEKPEHSDNLLLMADLMQADGRTDEAIALLQYVAEHASDDNGFVVAVDGIINMAGQRRFGEALTPALRDLFRWTQRIVLERITGRQDRFYLYRLLADIAVETGDIEGEYAAIENSLSQAGLRRGAILRELVTMSTPGAGFAGGNRGDSARQLRYARRLIGLRQQLPPEVYINVGQTLLEQGDTQGADKAFGLINDITGTIDVNATRASLYRDAGYLDRALSYYNRALSVDRDDLELLLRTGVLREAGGQDDVANELYLRALLNLLSAQPAVLKNDPPAPRSDPFAVHRPEVDVTVNRDYRTYYEALTAGLLITWPPEQASAEARIRAIEQRFDTELANVVALAHERERLPLARYPRLDRTARFMRRVAYKTGNPALAEYADRALLADFKQDTDYVRKIAGDYRDRGRAAIAGEMEAVAGLAAETPLRPRSLLSDLAAAKAAGDLETAVKLSRLLGDEQGLAALCRERIAEGEYRQGLGYARATLSEGEYRRFVSSIAPTLKDRPAAFVRLLLDDPALVADLEELTGRELISVRELSGLLESQAVQALLGESYGSMNPIWEYVSTKATLAEQLRFVKAAIGRQSDDRFGGILDMRAVFAHWLGQALTPAQKREISEVAATYLSGQDMKLNDTRARSLFSLLVLDAHPDNVELLYDLADTWMRWTRSSVDPTPLLRAHFNGADDLAFDELLALHRAGALGDGSWMLRYWTEAFFEDAHARVLAGLQNGERADPAIARTVYELRFERLFRRVPQVDVALMTEAAELLESLIGSYPDDDRYRRELIYVRSQLGGRTGDRRRLRQALADYYAYDPADEHLRAAYFVQLLADEQYAAAEAVATDGGADLRDEAVLAALTAALSQDARFQPTTGAGILFSLVGDGNARSRFPAFARVQRDVEQLRAALAEADDRRTRLALRAVWRQVHTDASIPAFASSRSPLVGLLLAAPLDAVDGRGYDPFERRGEHPYQSLAALIESEQTGEPASLLGAVAGTRFGAVELDRYLASMPAANRRASTKLYQLVADGYEAGGRLESRLAELHVALEDGALGDHEFTVWMLLREKSEHPLGGDELQAFRERETRGVHATDLQLLLAARLYAKGGAVADAVERYRLLAASQLKYGEFREDRRSFSRDREIVISVLDMIDDAVSRLPGEAALRLAESVLAIAARADRAAEYAAVYEALVLATLGKLMPASEALAAASDFSAAAVDYARPVQQAEVLKIMELMRLRAASGDTAKAADALRSLLAATQTVEADGDTQLFSSAAQRRYQVANNVYELCRLYGFSYHGIARRGTGSTVNLPLLIENRERVFSAWYGDAADSILGKLGAGGLNEDWALKLVFSIAYQLDREGQGDLARDIVSRAVHWMSGSRFAPNASVLQDLVTLALHLETGLPADLTRRILAQGKLTVVQETALIRALVDGSDARTALDVWRSLDEAPEALSLMRELKALADAADERDYAADLERRIGEAERARTRIDAGVLHTAGRSST